MTGTYKKERGVLLQGKTVLITGAAQAGLPGLKGHRSVGGMRASMYNAMPEAGVQALVDYMKEFVRSKG